jgi:F-type H+-transporting ATPase subunit b
MTSWLLLATADAVSGVASGAPEGGLFDLDATLPLMAVQVVLLTFILNALFFRPVGRAVEEREGYVATSRADAKQKLAQAERLEADLTAQLKEARLEAQKLIIQAEQETDKLYREALATAQAESIAVREQARRDIESEREKALGALKVQADRLGSLIVDRLLAAQ